MEEGGRACEYYTDLHAKGVIAYTMRFHSGFKYAQLELSASHLLPLPSLDPLTR